MGNGSRINHATLWALSALLFCAIAAHAADAPAQKKEDAPAGSEVKSEKAADVPAGKEAEEPASKPPEEPTAEAEPTPPEGTEPAAAGGTTPHAAADHPGDVLIVVGGTDLQLASGQVLHTTEGFYEVFEVKGVQRHPNGRLFYDVIDEQGHPITLTGDGLYARPGVPSIAKIRSEAEQLRTAEWSPRRKLQILTGYGDVGMTTKQLDLAWGAPKTIEHQGKVEIRHYEAVDAVIRHRRVVQIR
jgi:hypothetical protein